jgi:hypothetical protein
VSVDDLMELLDVHQVMHAREQQPFAASQTSDQWMYQRARLILVPRDYSGRALDDALTAADVVDERSPPSFR